MASTMVQAFLGYAPAFLFVALVVYVPGVLMAACLGMSGTRAWGVAPVLGLSCYCLLGVVLGFVHISWSAPLLVGCALALGVALCALGALLRRRRPGTPNDADASWKPPASERWYDWLMLLIYQVLGVATFAVLFGALYRNDVFVEGFDTVYHFGIVRSFMQSGYGSSLHLGLYLAQPDAQAPIALTTAFYPAGWHLLVAMVATGTGVTVLNAAGAVNAFLAGMVFPGSMYLLMRQVFDDRRVVACGSVCANAFVGFPWYVLLRGEQYPQLAALALVPAIAACFMAVWHGWCLRLALLSVGKELEASARVASGGKHAVQPSDGASIQAEEPAPVLRHALVFLVGCAGMVFLQTNGIFTVGVLVAPYMVSEVAGAMRYRRALRVLAPVLVAVGIAVVWVACYRLPMLQTLVHVEWPATLTLKVAVMRVAGLGMELGYQLPLAACVLAGMVALMLQAKRRWVAALYAFLCASLVIDLSLDGELKHLLNGFWYCDPDRIAANLSLAGMLVAAQGIAVVGAVMARLVRLRREGAVTVLAGLVALLVLAVSWVQPAGVEDGSATLNGFATLRQRTRNYFSPDGTPIEVEWEQLTYHELCFARDAEELIEPGVLVLNIPDDGSSFLYGIDGLNLYMRRGMAGSYAESKDSVALRTNVDDWKTDEAVAEALSNTDAKYVLLLGTGGSTFFHTYDASQWDGMNELDPDDPGFELLLTDGDCFLYRIDR